MFTRAFLWLIEARVSLTVSESYLCDSLVDGMSILDARVEKTYTYTEGSLRVSGSRGGRALFVVAGVQNCEDDWEVDGPSSVVSALGISTLLTPALPPAPNSTRSTPISSRQAFNPPKRSIGGFFKCVVKAFSYTMIAKLDSGPSPWVADESSYMTTISNLSRFLKRVASLRESEFSSVCTLRLQR